MNRFEQLVAEVFDDMMGAAKNNTYVFTSTKGGTYQWSHTKKGRFVTGSEEACYAYLITRTGNRPEGFHAWLEARP